jgi:hypothetical protein
MSLEVALNLMEIPLQFNVEIMADKGMEIDSAQSYIGVERNSLRDRDAIQAYVDARRNGTVRKALKNLIERDTHFYSWIRPPRAA